MTDLIYNIHVIIQILSTRLNIHLKVWEIQNSTFSA